MYHLVFLLDNRFFINFDNKLFFSAHIFNKLFFLSFVATNVFFHIFSSPPPRYQMVRSYQSSTFLQKNIGTRNVLNLQNECCHNGQSYGAASTFACGIWYVLVFPRTSTVATATTAAETATNKRHDEDKKQTYAHADQESHDVAYKLKTSN